MSPCQHGTVIAWCDKCRRKREDRKFYWTLALAIAAAAFIMYAVFKAVPQ